MPINSSQIKRKVVLTTLYWFILFFNDFYVFFNFYIYNFLQKCLTKFSFISNFISYFDKSFLIYRDNCKNIKNY